MHNRIRGGLLLVLMATGCGGDPAARLAEVQNLQQQGDFQASLELLGEILEAEPERAEAHYLRGVSLAGVGEPMRAAWPLQRAAKDEDFATPANLLLAEIYLQTRNYDESTRTADRVLAGEPNHAAALRTRGRAHLAARRIDAALHDAERLVELRPEDYEGQVLYASVLADAGHLEEARLAHERVKALGEDSDDPAVRARSCIAPALFAHQSLKQDEQARALYEACAAEEPTDLVALEQLVQFFDATEDPERATAILRRASEAHPEDLGLALAHAQRVLALGELERGETLLRAATDHFASAPAWAALASYLRQSGRHDEALRAIERTIELSPQADPLLHFTHADMLMDTGQLEEAARIGEALTHETYAHMIRGRILLLRGDAGGALAAFEQGLLTWPNNPGARFLAGLAARDLGDDERAIVELRESVRAGLGETHAALELARLHLQRGEPEPALQFATMAFEGPHSGRPEAYVMSARALVQQGAHEPAKRILERLEEGGHATLAARELALLERRRGDPAAALAALEGSGLDLELPKHFELLAQWVEAQSELGALDKARQRTEAALAREGGDETAALHQIHAVVLARQGHDGAAERAFQRAMALEGETAISLSGLAALRHAAGDPARAIDLLDRAYALDPGDGSHAYAAAQIVLQQGHTEEALRRLRGVATRHPGQAGASNDLAWLLAHRGEDLDQALELIRAARRRSEAPEFFDTLGYVHLRRGEIDPALAAYERAVELRPQSGTAHYHLALAQLEGEDATRVQKTLETALAKPSFPEQQEARNLLERLQEP